MSSRRCRVLVVDDEPAMREVLAARLERWGHPVQTAATAAAARAAVAAFAPHVVISDLVLPDATGLDLLADLRRGDAGRTILLITSYGTIDTAVAAIKGGATDFLTKPLDYTALKEQLDAAEARLQASLSTGEHHVAGASAGAGPGAAFQGGMVGQSAALLLLWQRVQTAAAAEAPVLIVGESGTGKELVARTVHALGPRKAGPFVAVNAAAVPESLVEGEFFGVEKGAFTGAERARPGHFEAAHKGVLFLDEVTEMPLSLQSKFLRVLEDGRIRRLGGRDEIACDVRVIAATNRDPRAAVAQGQLRADVLFRLDVLRLEVPPLRARRDDIPLLAAHFLADASRRYGAAAPPLGSAALAALAAHSWPGNVRELKNAIERAYVLAQGREVQAEHLGLPAVVDSAAADASGLAPAAAAAGGDAVAEPPLLHGIVIPAGVTLAEAERILILETLKRSGQNKAEAARRLGLDVKTIRNKLKVFDD